MDGHGKIVFSHLCKYRRKHFCGEQALSPGDIHGADHAAQVFFRRLHSLHVELLVRIPSHTAEDQPHTDPRIFLHSALCAADGRLHHLVLGEAAAYGKLRGKADLCVGHALFCQILHQLKGHTLDGVGSLKHHQRQREPLQVLLQGLAVLGDLHFKLYVLGRGSRNGDPLLLR